MIKDRYNPEPQETNARKLEARYAYYRRCQVFRKGGEQCKAPAEKGSHICYAHSAQLATAVRRERERRAVLEEAVAEMRKRGRPDCEMADLFMDFSDINVTLAVMARAVIDGRIHCKTAGRLVVQLQTVSKLLWMLHRKGREENPLSPQICADYRGFRKEKDSTTKDTRSTSLSQAQGPSGQAAERQRASGRSKEKNWAANERGERRIALVAELRAVANRCACAHGPPGLLKAA